MRTALREAWAWFRAVFGDSAYESYVRHARSHGHPAPTREQFYLETLHRRYSTISRCC